MQVLIVALALVGIACGDVSHLPYKYPAPVPNVAQEQLSVEANSPQNIAPVENKQTIPLAAAPAPENILPAVTPATIPETKYIPPGELEDSSPLGNPVPVHLPQPVAEVLQIKKPVSDGYNYVAPKQPVAPIPEETSVPDNVVPAHELTKDGYRYKTVRRIRYRYRV